METTAIEKNKWAFGEGFQLKAIALSLRDPDFLIQHMDVFDPNYFENDYLNTIARLILDYFNVYRIPPTREVIEIGVNDYATKYGGNDVMGLQTTFTQWLSTIYQANMTDSEFIYDKMVRFAQRQAMKSVLGKGVDMLESDVEDLSKLREILEGALQVGSIRDKGINFTLDAPRLNEILRDDPIHGIANKVPTGYAPLDINLGGGMGAGELLVVGGPPGRGKTTFLVNLGRVATTHFALTSQNKIVVHVTLEMKGPDMALKYASCYTGITTADILENTAEYQIRITTHIDMMGSSNVRIKYFSPGTITVEEIRWYISNLAISDKVDIGLIIIDYADELKGADIDPYLTMGKIYSQLIAMGDTFRCPVATGTQIGRGQAEENIINSSGVAESWKKVQKADILVTLCQTPAEHKAKMMRLFFPKVRRAEDKFIIPCMWDGSVSTIRAMTQDEHMAAREILSSEMPE